MRNLECAIIGTSGTQDLKVDFGERENDDAQLVYGKFILFIDIAKINMNVFYRHECSSYWFRL